MLLKCRMRMVVYLALPSLTLVQTNVAEPSEPVGLTYTLGITTQLCTVLGLLRTLSFDFLFWPSAAGRVFVLGWHQHCVKHGWKQILITILRVHLIQTFSPLKCTIVTSGKGVRDESVLMVVAMCL